MFIYTFAKQRKQRGDYFREHFIFLFLQIDKREITKLTLPPLQTAYMYKNTYCICVHKPSLFKLQSCLYLLSLGQRFALFAETIKKTFLSFERQIYIHQHLDV
jgi:hypothetical protein